MKNDVIWQKPLQKSVWYAEWMRLWTVLADAAILGTLLETIKRQDLSPTLSVGTAIVALILIWQVRYTTASPLRLISNRISTEIIQRLYRSNPPNEDKHIKSFTRHLRAFFVTDCLLSTAATCTLLLVIPGGWFHTAVIPAALLLMLPITIGAYYAYIYFKQAEWLVKQMISE